MPSELPTAKKRINRMVVDTNRQRMFVAALGNNSVEVVDPTNHRVIKSMTGFKEPQDVLLLSKQKRLFVSNG